MEGLLIGFQQAAMVDEAENETREIDLDPN
jgi:hypothetical protein